ncbi:MAG TPA: dTMP kinase [Actinomycetota bacterium]|nr:dTMP kinase [Actinomycetota bacterium]
MATAAEEIAALRGTRPATLRSLLRDPVFSRLYRAILVSSLGDWVGFLAVVGLVTRIGGGRAGLAVSGVMLARLLPSIVFGPFAGVLVDRFDRKRLMVIADVVRGIGYASLPLIPRLPWIFGMSFVIECLSLLWTPARDAIIPNIVSRRQLSNANTVSLATGYGTLPLGGIVYTAITGGAIALGSGVEYIRTTPESVALWLDALTFFFSAQMIRGLPAARVGRPAKAGSLKAGEALADLREGVRFLKEHTFARAMTVGIVMAFTGAGAVMAVGPIFASDPAALGGGPTAWGILVTAVGLGLAGGMVFVGQVYKVFDKDVLFSATIMAGAAALILVAATPNITLAALATVVMGAAAGATWVTGYTLLHENVTDELRGRVFGSLTVLARLGLFLSLAGFPLLAEAFPDHVVSFGDRTLIVAGTRQALWVGAVIMILGGVWSRSGLSKSRLTRARPLRLFPRLRKTEKHGTFIAFEGVEGAGKGTQVGLAKEYLESLGYDVLVTREPGGTELGESLRDTLLRSDSDAVDSRAEALLFAAGRAQHVSRVLRPALEEGKIVLCDRYLDSSLAYQGTGRGLGEQDVLSLNVWATQGLFPDLVILLHIDPDKALARSRDELDRIESAGEVFHAKVAEAFMRIAEDHPERFVVVDADAPPDVVHDRVKDALRKYLKPEEERG